MNKAKKKINQEEKHYEHKPVRDFKASISKDGKYWVFKDITTHFVPRKYLSTIESDFVIGGSQVADVKNINKHSKDQ